ncbi:MAG TPA: PIN domain-containing protein [Patescibacteria group bacterium]|nr:PIN domain-containing protein [Patescibacteria group bacterium]
MNKSPLVIVDADIIVAQAYIDDANHSKTLLQVKKLAKNGAHILFPSTAVTEAITVIQRKLSNPHLAAATLELFSDPNMLIETVDAEIIYQAQKYFNPNGSKKNTFFDCVVAAIAKKHQADAIFSFDGWYEKLGFTLVSHLDF